VPFSTLVSTNRLSFASMGFPHTAQTVIFDMSGSARQSTAVPHPPETAKGLYRLCLTVYRRANR
jgi:hypothetical protein